MSQRALRSDDIEVFSEAISHFFATMTEERANVRSAYLLEEQEPIVRDDFNGVITVSGGYIGSVTFSAPRALLNHVLLRMGEQQLSDEHRRDVVGEITNTLSGWARRHFGDRLRISPPRAFHGHNQRVEKLAQGTPYAIPLRWKSYEANLVVHLDVVE
jgi:chemotaxis protein CheX